jgi:hypothetical protein
MIEKFIKCKCRTHLVVVVVVKISKNISVGDLVGLVDLVGNLRLKGLFFYYNFRFKSYSC